MKNNSFIKFGAICLLLAVFSANADVAYLDNEYGWIVYLQFIDALEAIAAIFLSLCAVAAATYTGRKVLRLLGR